LEEKLAHGLIKLHRCLTEILKKNRIDMDYIKVDTVEVSLNKIEKNLSTHIEERKKALPQMQEQIVSAFGQKVSEEMNKVEGSFGKLDKSFRKQFEEVGFKLEEIAKSETLIGKMREENKALEATVEEYKRREGEFEELKKTVNEYK
jgi:hypothetical protein